jgi:ferredoxin/bacterioferritin-associated ferredoxin
LQTIELGIEVIDENCTGCYRCERVCPTEAIVMVGPKTEALAVVDNDKCIACMRCIDSCDDDALVTIVRDEPINVEVDTTDIDEEAIKKICFATNTPPSHLVCPCSNRSAQEIVATILQGADSYEKLSLRIGVQSGCLMYCSVGLRRLLVAATGEARTESKLRRYNTDQALMNIEPDLDSRYPLFGIRVEQGWRTKESAEAEVDL